MQSKITFEIIPTLCSERLNVIIASGHAIFYDIGGMEKWIAICKTISWAGAPRFHIQKVNEFIWDQWPICEHAE